MQFFSMDVISRYSVHITMERFSEFFSKIDSLNAQVLLVKIDSLRPHVAH